VTLTLAAAGLLLASYAFPYWQMELDSPQAPKLHLSVYLHGFGGDVWEIDILNRYVGMRSIATAARLERQLSLFGLILIAVLLVLSLFAGRLSPWLKVPGILFPAIFVGVKAYFLYNYGHDLDPFAPIRIEPFMPALIGEQHIPQAQVTTYSSFEIGFFMSLTAAGLLLLTLVIGALRSSASHSTSGIDQTPTPGR
jgi:hypothetical protein